MFRNTIKYRTTYEEVANYYGRSAESAIKDGNYTLAALLSKDEPLIRGPASIMLGYPEKGIALLDESGQNSPESYFYKSFGYWCLGEMQHCNSEAERLSSCRALSPIHEKYLSLLGKNKINVLLLNKELYIPKKSLGDQFNVISVGFSRSDDIRLDLGSDADYVVKKLKERSFNPDFIFAFRPEYLLIYKGFERFRCPKIAFLSDFDLHLYQKYDDFDKFDAYIVYSSVDHYEVSRIFRKQVFTHLFFHSLPQFKNRSCNEWHKRKLDIHVTGSSFRSFFADKSSLLYELTQLDESYAVRIDDGFSSPSSYLRSLQNTRFVPTFVRFYGCFPTRGIEALMCGANVLYPEGGVLELLLDGEKDGIFSYRSETISDDLSSLFCRIPSINTAGMRSDIASLFDYSRTFPMFLKYCALISTSVTLNSCSNTSQIRDCYSVVGHDDLHGGIGKGMSGEQHCANFRRIIEYNEKLPQNKHVINSIAITYMYWLLHLDRGLTWYSDGTKERCIRNAIKILQQGVEDYNDQIVLRFNLGRIHFHYDTIERAETVFLGIINNSNMLRIEPYQDDLMSALFFYEDYFPYRQYIDELVISKKRSNEPEECFCIILSASALYLSEINEKKEILSEAIYWARRSLEYFESNYIAKNKLAQLLYKAGLPSENSAAKEIVRLYEESVQSYIRYLHPGIIDYVEALIVNGDIQKAKMALNCWYRFFTRVRKKNELLEIDRNFLRRLLDNQHLMDPVAQSVFNNVYLYLQRMGQVKVFSELEEEIILRISSSITDTEQILISFKSGEFIIQCAETFRTMGSRFLRGRRFFRGIYCYGMYYRMLFNKDDRMSPVDFINSFVECIADILQCSPILYRVARHLRQYFLNIMLKGLL